MNEEELKAFCELLMVSDPWPTEKFSEDILKLYADKQAQKHGFTDWIEFYNESA